MKTNSRLAARWMTAAAVCLLWIVLPVALHAQNTGCASFYQGDKLAWYGSGTGNYFNYHDYIDVSSFTTIHDVCQAISTGLTNLIANQVTGCPTYSHSGVIDARGVAPGSAGTISCASSNNLFQETASAYDVTVLLPAGTITVGAPWYLPQNTRLIGEGPVSNTTTPASVTRLLASGFTGAMIYMGDSQANTVLCSTNCNGISIEHLTLDGNNTAGLDGIDNYYAQELNYVNDVALMNIAGTGLMIVGQNATSPGMANNSGPYTNIYFSGSGNCVNINGTNNTRGINGLDCHGTTGTAGPAIKLDGHNNIIQNVTISGYGTQDGVAIGSQGGYAQNNVLLSIASTSVKNVIHISNNANGAPTDLTLMGISGGTTNTIWDEVTSSKIPTDNTGLAFYVLGEPIMSGSNVVGYSRFTSASSSGTNGTPAWYQGAAVPTSGCAGVAMGSLYSVTTTLQSGSTLWGCIGTSWVDLSGSN